MPDRSSSPSPGIWATLAAVFQQNRLPGLILNVLVAALVGSYYFWPEVAGIWQAIGDLKTHWSFVFSLLSTILVAAILPFLIQWAMGTLPPEGRTRRLLALALFWGYRGMEIDLMYQIQARLFGDGHDFQTLAIKVAVDQFIYSAFWAVPTYLIALRWVDHNCSWRLTRASLTPHFWRHTYPSVLLTNWLVWIPTVTLVYSLPSPLQFPLFSVVMCFFVLIVTLLARGNTTSAPASVA